MDIFRYFHPHHNPRLRNVGIRLQELSELEQAARELKRAIERAKLRSERAPAGKITHDLFDGIVAAMDYSVESLATLVSAHPGDDISTVLSIANERKDSPGWDNWAELVQQRLREVEPEAKDASKAS